MATASARFQLHVPNPSSDLYVHELQAVYDQGFRIWDPDIALRKDPQFDAKVRRDPIIQQGLDVRTNAIAGKDWTLEPDSERKDDVLAAQILEKILRFRLGNFRQQRKKLAMAVFDGRSYGFIEGERAMSSELYVGEDSYISDWWVPTRIRDLSERRVQLFFEDVDGKRAPVWKVWDLDAREWRLLDRQQTIEVVYEDTEERLGYGRGLREAVYYYKFFKDTVQEMGLRGLERWAMGVPVAKIDTSRRGAESGQAADDLRASYLASLKKLYARWGGYAMDKNDELEVLFGSGEANSMVMDWLDKLDHAMTRMITGSLLPTGGGEQVGSLARTEEEADTSEGVVEYDRGVMDDVMTRDYVAPIFRWNRAQFIEVGLEGARCPTFVTQSIPKEDPQENRENLKTARDIGLAVKKTQAYTMLGLEQPGEGDEVLEPMPMGDPLGGVDPFGGLPTGSKGSES